MPLETTTNSPAATAFAHAQTPRSTDRSAPNALEPSDLSQDSQRNPLESASWFSRMTLSWMNALLRKGHAAPLTEDDVWSLSAADSAAALQEAFDRFYQRDSEVRKLAGTRDASPSILRPLWRATQDKMALAIALYVSSAALSVLQPLLIKALLLFLQGEDNMFGITSGYLLAALLAATTFASVSALDYGMFLAMRAGLNARTIAVNSVYQKLLKLSASARQATTSGDIITLAGVDSERLFEAYTVGIWTFVSPLTIAAVCVLIGVEMDWYVALAAAACCSAILVFAMRNSRSIGRCRRAILTIAGERIKVTNEALQGIRVIKMYAWEDTVAARVREIREREIATLRSYDYLRASNMVVLSLAQTFMVALCIAVYVYRGNAIDVPTTFTLLAFAGVCRQPFGIFSSAVVFVSEANASMQRIATFLASDEVEQSSCLALPTADDDTDDSAAIEIRDGAFSWTRPADSGTTASSPPSLQREFTLTNINLSIRSGSLTIVVGAVGSGKSSLMSALLGEMHQSRGTRKVRGSIAFASQQAWVQQTTVRDNILFGAPFDRALYANVLAACQLKHDVASLSSGDMTEIGERGSNLSGGQRARVSLARAMYRRDAETLVLDDPLSALDPHVASAVFTECVLGLAHHKTRVLVLNSHYHLLRHADRVIVLGAGAIVSDGTYEDVERSLAHLTESSYSRVSASGVAAPLLSGDDEASSGDCRLALASAGDSTHDRESATTMLTDGAYDDAQSSLTDEELGAAERTSLRHTSRASTRSTTGIEEGETATTTQQHTPMMQPEDRATGKLGWRVYTEFFAMSGFSGVGVSAVVVAAFAVGQGTLLGSDYFLKYWSNGAMNGSFKQTTLLWLYVAMVAGATLMLVLRAVLFTEICLRCSKALHALSLSKVLRAPVPTFFDVTPVGQILNRFSRDLEQIDNPLAYYAMGFLMFLMSTLAILIVCAAAAPYALVLYAPLLWACGCVQQHYQASARELKRLDGTTRSPFLALVTETIDGIESIRAFTRARHFAARAHALLDQNGKCFFAYQSASKWFVLRLDWLVSTVACVVAFVCVATRGSIGAASAGLALTYAIQLAAQFQRVLTMGAMTDNFMTSFERMAQYTHLRAEGAAATGALPHTSLTPSWPRTGALAFENVSVRYRDGLDLALTNVSFAVRSGERIGVCGRTGSGKSTLLSALFRVVECEAGRIVIDGVDIARVRVQDVRAQLTVIPQDPVLFSGSLRQNLDPRNEHTDSDVWCALRHVLLIEDMRAWGRGLDADVAEHGANLSVGQRQLVCIARALLRPSRIVVLDEATASVDEQLDRRIQKAMRTRFAGKTTLTIAHRLESIADSDRVLVLAHGRVAEFDVPATLLATPSSAYALFVASAKQ